MGRSVRYGISCVKVLHGQSLSCWRGGREPAAARLRCGLTYRQADLAAPAAPLEISFPSRSADMRGMSAPLTATPSIQRTFVM
jgi:hypothetical protein